MVSDAVTMESDQIREHPFVCDVVGDGWCCCSVRTTDTASAIVRLVKDKLHLKRIMKKDEELTANYDFKFKWVTVLSYSN
jgi:hypothetical protein